MELVIGGRVFREIAPRRYVLTVAPTELRQVVETLVAEESYLSAIVAVDYPEEGRIELSYIFWNIKHGSIITVKVSVSRVDPRVPTISDIVPGALGGELEAYDLMGVVFEGNNKLKRGFLAPEDLVVRDVYPLRKDARV